MMILISLKSEGYDTLVVPKMMPLRRRFSVSDINQHDRAHSTVVSRSRHRLTRYVTWQ